MAGKTITTEAKVGGLFTIAEINALFTEVATVLNNKIDLEDGATLSTENFNCGAKQVINVPDPVLDSDLVPLVYLGALV